MKILREDSRNQLISKSRKSPKGKQRYNRRLKSSISSSVREYNQIDMNKLFKDNILTVAIPIRGETDNYVVRISFGGFCDMLHDELEHNNGKLDLRVVLRALMTGFNKEDVYIGCDCPDFFYRYGYYATKNNISSLAPQNIPSDITNPDDSLGSGCKHVLLVLSNTKWIIKVASVIRNYINYAEEHLQRAYAEVIYPAIYKKKYEEPYQPGLFDKDEIETDQEIIDVSNKAAQERGRFKPGNQQGVQFASNEKDSEQPEFELEG